MYVCMYVCIRTLGVQGDNSINQFRQPQPHSEFLCFSSNQSRPGPKNLEKERSVVQVCGPGLWSRSVVQVCGPGLWSRSVVQVCGPGLWSRSVVQVYA